MNVNLFLNIIGVLLYVILGGVILYFKSNAKLKGKAVELINTAEGMYTDTLKAGGKRFEWVVNSLYELLPKTVRLIVSKEMVETIVQNVFDQMKEFAKKNLDAIAMKYTD